MTFLDHTYVCASPPLTLNGVVLLHLSLVVVVQAVDRLAPHVLPLVGPSVHRGPHLLQLLVRHLEVRGGVPQLSAQLNQPVSTIPLQPVGIHPAYLLKHNDE